MSTEIAIYQPTPAQRLAKAKLHASLEGSWRSVESMSIDQIASIAGTTSVKKWMSNPEFVAYFLNADTAKHKLMATAELAVDALEEVLRSPLSNEVTASNKIAAAQAVIKAAGLEAPKKVETKNTNTISDMNAEELKTFLLSNVKKLIATLPPEERDELLDTLTINK